MNHIDCIIVMGMHRSGTSVLAGCLKMAGVNLGRSMMPPTKDNPAGYWENNDFVITHDILLRDLGCNWHTVGALPEGWLDSEAANKARQRIKRLIEVHYQGRGLWAIKDPRMCRLMPLWQSILNEMGIRPGFAVTLRHPLEVARSLTKRDKLSLRKGLLLWLVHNREAFAACMGNPCTVHTYDQLLADPISTLQRMEQGLNMRFPKPLHDIYPELLNFVQPALRNHHAGRGIADEEPASLEYALSTLFSQLYTEVLQCNVHSDSGPPTDCTATPSSPFHPKFPLLRSSTVAPATCLLSTSPAYTGASEHTLRLFDELLAHLGELERDWHSHQTQKERISLSGATGALVAQIFLPQREGQIYIEQHSLKFPLLKNQWQEIRCTIPDPALLSIKPLRLDPLNACGTIQIASLRLYNPATGNCLIQADSPADFPDIRPARHAMILPDQPHVTVASTGFDPQLFLPLFADSTNGPLELQLWLRAEPSLECLHGAWNDMVQHCDTIEQRHQNTQTTHTEAMTAAKADFQASQAEIAALKEEIAQFQERELDLSRERQEQTSVEVSLRNTLEAKEQEIQRLHDELAEGVKQEHTQAMVMAQPASDADAENLAGLGHRAGDSHYRAYVGPPLDYDLIAAMVFNLMTSLGLRQHHRVLDLGCGSLRVGRLLIPYLNPEHYIGLEPHRWLTDQGIDYEIGKDCLAIKRPQFIFTDSLENFTDSLEIDLAVAQSIFSHCGKNLIRKWLSQMARHLKEDGALLATFLTSDTDYAEDGWVYNECVKYRPESMANMAAEHGFGFQMLDWAHPRQSWAIFYRQDYDLDLVRDGQVHWNRFIAEDGKTITAQIFFPLSNGPTYAEDRSRSFPLVRDTWQDIVCDIPNPAHLTNSELRYDPANCPGMISIQFLKLVNRATDQPLFQAQTPADFQSLRTGGDAQVVSGQDVFTLRSLGHDPQLYIPPLSQVPDGPIELRVRLRVRSDRPGRKK